MERAMVLIDLNGETNSRLNNRQEPVAFDIASHSDFTRLKEVWAERLMVPILLRERGEGLDASFGGRDSRILLSGDDSAGRYCIEDVIYAPGWETPAYHMEEAEEHWTVIEGEVEITVGNQTEICQAGASAFIPRNTTRALRNVSSSPARLFQWSNPAGFDRAVQELALTYRDHPDVDAATVTRILAKYAIVVHEGEVSLPNDAHVNDESGHIPFDSDSLDSFMRFREVWAAQPMIPRLVLKPSDGTPVDAMAETNSWCVVTGDESAGRAMVGVAQLPPGLFVPPHYQPTEEEIFYALDEGIWWRIGDRETTTKKGSFAFAPRYGTHQFGNPTDGPAWFMTINSPAGHERALAKVRDKDLSSPEQYVDFFTKWGWVIQSPEPAT
jgi:quercetin dioxygenase-like cupin family protein